MNNASYQLHLAGQKHKRKLKELGLTESIQNLDIVNNNTKQNQAAKFRCEICDLSVPTNEQLAIHLSGKKHLKKASLQKQNEPKVLVENNCQINRCEICDLNVVSQEQLNIHLAGKKHLKKLASLSIVVSSSLKENQKADGKNLKRKIYKKKEYFRFYFILFKMIVNLVI